jgi:septal ring factor EnvC (AmiA/AmiB activator)
MKRIFFFLCTALLAAPTISPAQDAATEERLNKLSAEIDVLTESKDQLNKKIDGLESEIRDLQTQVSKPTGNYASADDVKQLKDAIEEVDKKRQEDNERVVKELQNLGKSLNSSAPPRRSSTSTTSISTGEATSNGPQDGYYYTVQDGNTLAEIVKAYRDKGIKVTVQQVLDANPGLKATNLKVNQKIFIPKPKQ